MNRISLPLLAGVLLIAAGCADKQREAQRERDETERFRALDSANNAAMAGFVPLFDGKSLKGWTQRGGKAEYVVDAADATTSHVPEIVGKTVPNTPNSFLCTDKTYADFELTLEFKTHPKLNSGVQFRSLSSPDYQNGRVHGYQAEIDPSDRAWTGGLYDEGRRGWLADLKANAAARAAFKQGEWNTMRILAQGDTISTWINEVPVVQGFKDDRTREGFIALQVHDIGKNTDPMEVRWRKIYLREIPANTPAK